MSDPTEAKHLGEFLLRAGQKYGAAEAMDDGSEIVTYATLFRRAIALSCFVDETAKSADAVLLYVPSGITAIRSAFSVWATGRAVSVIDAAHPSLESLDSSLRPSLILTVRGLERRCEELIAQSALQKCPVLFADDIAAQMDELHQEEIRNRLKPGFLESLAGRDPGSVAWIAAVKSGGPGDAASVRTHADCLASISESQIAPVSGLLAMSGIDRFETWAGAYLPTLAAGGKISFLRFFDPGHVLEILRQNSIGQLVLGEHQYLELIPALRDAADIESVRCCTLGPPSKAIQQQWTEATGSPLVSLEDPSDAPSPASSPAPRPSIS